MSVAAFSLSCQRCQRLRLFLHEVQRAHPDYYCQPVPSFGSPQAALLIVGLAPGMHGANATGRPFTGDHAGVLLYKMLYDFGFASAPQSLAATDGLQLINCRITNAVRCLPPQNKPAPQEITNCNSYLADELAVLASHKESTVVLALGAIAHKAVIKALGLKQADFPFGHGLMHALPNGQRLVDSYHCSRYNTQTGRLTVPMFVAIFQLVRELLATMPDTV